MITRQLILLAQRNISSTFLARLSTYPKIGQLAPNFQGQAVINGHFKKIKLADYRGKYVVLFFYPLDFTFVCPTEIIGFNERLSEFSQLNTQIIGCSTDSIHSHLGRFLARSNHIDLFSCFFFLSLD